MQPRAEKKHPLRNYFSSPPQLDPSQPLQEPTESDPSTRKGFYSQFSKFFQKLPKTSASNPLKKSFPTPSRAVGSLRNISQFHSMLPSSEEELADLERGIQRSKSTGCIKSLCKLDPITEDERSRASSVALSTHESKNDKSISGKSSKGIIVRTIGNMVVVEQIETDSSNHNPSHIAVPASPQTASPQQPTHTSQPRLDSDDQSINSYWSVPSAIKQKNRPQPPAQKSQPHSEGDDQSVNSSWSLKAAINSLDNRNIPNDTNVEGSVTRAPISYDKTKRKQLLMGGFSKKSNQVLMESDCITNDITVGVSSISDIQSAPISYTKDNGPGSLVTGFSKEKDTNELFL